MVRWKLVWPRAYGRLGRETGFFLLFVLLGVGGSSYPQALIASQPHDWGNGGGGTSWKYEHLDVRRMVDAKWGKKTIRWLHSNGGQGSRTREKCVEDGGCEVGLGATVRVNFVKGR
jgi:hypothetical protein